MIIQTSYANAILAEHDPYPDAPDSAFWLWPDYSGGDNLRDPGTEPFWMRPSARPQRKPTIVRSCVDGQPVLYGVPRTTGSFIESWGEEHRGDVLAVTLRAGEHRCVRFVTLWTGWRYCVDCEAGSYPTTSPPASL
jgi:hypothetical protein